MSEINYQKIVRKCRDCPDCTNSDRLHNDAFSQAPYHTQWYCEYYFGTLRPISDESVIDKGCPFLKENNG